MATGAGCRAPVLIRRPRYVKPDAQALPELPEIEHLKRTLGVVIVGAVVDEVRLLRPDIVHPFANGRPAIARTDLLLGSTITALARRGKQLAIIGDGNAVLCVHLGMSGQLQYVPYRQRLPRTDHIHCIWRLRATSGDRGRLVFRDPRRFGGLWLFRSLAALREERWSRLGPDALGITAPALGMALARTRRPLKAALLDQSLLCGLGNIYVDECLFAARLDPRSVSRALGPAPIAALASAIRSILRRAIAAGGSTIRDYLDASGRPGSYHLAHRVYGRAGQPCLRCRRTLRHTMIAQRSTVFCSGCQHL